MKVNLTVTIELGNDAMQTGRDVANALLGKVPRIAEAARELLNDGGRIMDDNGNAVGVWSLDVLGKKGRS